MKKYHLDPEKISSVRRNTIILYTSMSLVILGVIYVYIRDALFGKAWALIPFTFLLFIGAGWLSMRDRKKYWKSFELIVQDNGLRRSAFRTPTVRLERARITKVREVKNGLIVSTRANKNALLIPKSLPDKDYQKIKRIVENWASKAD